MSRLITPTELPKWVPGTVTAASDGLDWKGVAMRGYLYKGQDVHIPPMRDFMIVSYRHGATRMERRFDGAWTKTQCAPGSVSLLTRSQACHWNWTEDINVSHVYLENSLVRRVASEALDRDVHEVILNDVLNVEDPVVTQGVEAIQREANEQALGGSLYAEAVGAQLVLHLLRNYAAFDFRDADDHGGLSAPQARQIRDYIDAHLDEAIDLQSLAASVGLGVWSFSRRFRETFGQAPYRYVVNRRIDRAKHLLEAGDLAIKEVAAACGFSDQAHLTRAFRARLGATPAQYRAGRSN